jgi:hypothetical protein
LPWLTLTSAAVVPHLCVLLQLTDYRSQIRSYVFDVVRATVPKIILDDVFVVSGMLRSAKCAVVSSRALGVTANSGSLLLVYIV